MRITTSLLTVALLACCSVASWAQSNNNEDQVVKIDKTAPAYRPGQVLVKFKDDSSVSISGRKKASSSAVQQVVSRLGVSDMEQLMPVGGKIKMKPSPRLRSFSGKMIEDRDLSKLYLVSFDIHRTPDVHEAVEAFQQLDEVEFAEPNYMVFALGSPAAPKSEAGPLRNSSNGPTTFSPTDPLYSEQWGPAAINLPQLWATETENVLGRRPVIAILDTGVDTTHPDLQDNIWTNEKEANGVDGEDDDLNGYTDDLHGWDCVNQTGRIGDWNGHGTHCAGIAAAVQGNGIGIVGANPDALIMPVTVLQSDGSGDMGTIIRGLEYTLTHDVDVISMSLGGYSTSRAEELALGKVYNRSVIVAAAGNDGLCIYPGHSMCSKPMFPGALTFVLGVKASQQLPLNTCGCAFGTNPYNLNPWRTCWSNFDDDGPIYSSFDEEKIYNYELLVPGANIMSTYPGGRYISMNGTSMATPLAAGAISRLLETKEYSSKELLFGDLIGSANADSKIMDVLAAYKLTDADRKPTLMLVGYTMRDSIGGDNDGRFDAGEIIELYPILRNTWGEAVGIKCSIATSDNEDPEIIEILDNDVEFGRTLHSYGKEHSVNPIRFKINESCVDGRHIRLTISSTCENGTGETIAQNILITAENGEELGGIIEKNTTLVAGKHYIVNRSLAIPAGITLSIPAGTTIKLHDGALIKVSAEGRIVARGTADAPIIFTKGDLYQGAIPALSFNGNCVFRYCQFRSLSSNGWSLGSTFTDCIFQDCDFGLYGLNNIKTTRCNIVDNSGFWGIEFDNTHRNTNIIGNRTTCPNEYHPEFNTKWKDVNACNVYGNYSNYMRRYANIACVDLEPTIIYYDYPSYLGASKEENVRPAVMDYENDANDVYYVSFAKVDLKNMLTEPNGEAHGIVWRILVDGLDAQDDYDLIAPLGVGTHRVDVCFNRQMDTSIMPYVSMGVRPPYTQTLINENPSWNEEGTVYTAYFTITAKSAFDGVNRFLVADAQDTDHFTIPTESFRFNVPVSAAGSKSTGFMAEAGLGLVKLSWNALSADEVEDVMGYNVYRYTMDDEGLSSDTIRANVQLIESEGEESLSFTDYDVIPGTTYYYYYRALRSTLDSTEPSLTVASTPYTASKGDANGSMEVNVADVVAEIAYLTGQNPKPFIFDAADVNSDETVNILDVVGTINIIMAPTAPSGQALATATYTIEDGLLYIDSPVSLAGLQVWLKECNGQPTPLAALSGMEYASSPISDGYQFLAYSLAGRAIPAGHRAVLHVGDSEVAGIVLSDRQGREVTAAYTLPSIIESITSLPQGRAGLPTPIYDLQGRKVSEYNLGRGVYIVNGKKICF